MIKYTDKLSTCVSVSVMVLLLSEVMPGIPPSKSPELYLHKGRIHEWDKTSILFSADTGGTEFAVGDPILLIGVPRPGDSVNLIYMKNHNKKIAIVVQRQFYTDLATSEGKRLQRETVENADLPVPEYLEKRIIKMTGRVVELAIDAQPHLVKPSEENTKSIAGKVSEITKISPFKWLVSLEPNSGGARPSFVVDILTRTESALTVGSSVIVKYRNMDSFLMATDVVQQPEINDAPSRSAAGKERGGVAKIEPMVPGRGDTTGSAASDTEAGSMSGATDSNPVASNREGHNHSGKKVSMKGCIDQSGSNYTLMDKKHPEGVQLSSSQDLSAHVGHKVEVKGTWADSGSSMSSTGSGSSGSGSSGSSSTAASGDNMSGGSASGGSSSGGGKTINVTDIKMISDHCDNSSKGSDSNKGSDKK